jgi:hypothetical protein
VDEVDVVDEEGMAFPLFPFGGVGWGVGAFCHINPTHKPRDFVMWLVGATRIDQPPFEN